MIVDDSPTVRKLVSMKLGKFGHRVITAVDGVDALAKMTEEIPDLILIDVAMPRIDGYQLCKLIKNNVTTQNVPIVMLSGKDGLLDKVRGKMAGASDYMTKPFEPETLLQTVNQHCGIQSN
jgi:twitching motility two-component system response regulator PilG